MTVSQVLAGVKTEPALPAGLASCELRGLDYDSRRIRPDFLFVAFAGQRADGRLFAQQAVEKGALAILSELEKPNGFTGAPWLRVEHGRKALAAAVRNFTGAPDSRIQVTGVTGTNGKTTTCHLLDSILRAAGRTTALIGTVEYRIAGTRMPAVNTTPESLDVFRMLSQLEEAGGTHASMEVSSHALALGRVWGLQFHTAIFTNLTRDHLDFHGDMESYFAAKCRLFTGPPAPAWAVLNADDEFARRIPLVGQTKALYYTLREDGGQEDLRAANVGSTFEGLRFVIQHVSGQVTVESPMTGRINVYNILAAAGAALSLGVDWDSILRGVAACRGVPGRFERVDEGQPFLLVVDYAHTDDALRNVIGVARGLRPKRIITLFGCGGDRDRSKRPLMGMAAASLSDYVVLTSDNPRSEDPLAIINDALVGLRRFDTPHTIEVDREKAIRAAIEQAAPGDVVILAGKGHETYQVLKDRTIAFDDRDVARAVLRSFGYGRRS
jgi:UDP-N-acetylmuramoyl-L-alanyl-D-glutamate--2,6-diaminopimelate ligase